MGQANVPAMVAILRAELARARGDAERTGEFAQQGLARAHTDDVHTRLIAGEIAVGPWRSR
jgi:hypothetical protein